MITVLHESDARHGWLIVSEAETALAGLTAEDFTCFSYTTVIDGKRIFALEEDRDGNKFHIATRERGIAWNYTRKTRNRSDVRNWDSIERIQSHALELAVM